VIHLHSVSKQFGSKILFENAEANIGNRSRIALIGPNGAGKSTLIRMILGHESPDSGQISQAQHLAIGHLAQEIPKFSGRTVLEEVMRLDGRREELLKVRQEYETAFSKSTSQTSSDPEALDRYGRILEELEGLDEYRLESKAKEILTGMGFKITDLDRSLTEFSGGWLMRVALSRILLMNPDLLLLDEPTNHLDLESLLWLEDFLGSHRGAILLVSHDREFLNRLVHEVLEIDQNKLWNYRGNLDSYVEQKKQRLEILKSRFESQQARIAEIESFVSRFGAKATKARQAQSRLKELEKMEKIELPDQRATVRFRFPPAPHSGKEVVTVQGASVKFGTKTVFEKLDWVIRRGSRVAIVGVNGAGKTTLLRLLSQAISPSGGTFKLGHAVQIGYYAQLQAESLDLSKTILEELEMTAPHLPISQVRGIAGAFLFSGDAVEKKCAVLSGGEKARVALAKLLLSPSNFLLLDEPTNHLDVESREVLLEALQDYEGTLCLVSHDRSFVSPLVDTVLEIIPSSDPSAGSRVHHLVESYEDYLRRKSKEVSQVARLSSALGSGGESRRNQDSSSKSSSPEQPLSKGPSNNQKQSWIRERERLEAEIGKLEIRQSELHTQMADPTTYENKAVLLELMEEQRSVEKSLGEKMARWEEVCTLLG
jgi:ATP-binding cassette subfamily F protein 3